MALLDMKTDSSSFPSSSSAAVRWNYDVFLSFRGKDTRYNFVGHLYEALIQKGIHIFKDDINLDRGRPILPELLKAIGESRFAIVIISEDYASSDSCLVELAHIIHCKKEMGMTILPVFHHVDPSNIRKQLGTFEQAFIEHEKKENKETVEKWRDALREVGSLSGWHLKEYCSEIENIKDIVGCISLHLKYDALPYIAKDLVGINSRMEEFESHLALGSNDVRFIGIWGMGGMGKTTLARVVYYMVSIKFEACSFIEDVRERSERDGLVTLQQDLISDILKGTDLKIRDKYDGVINIRNRLRCKRILLVLDDVDKLDQLKFLVGEHDWFGPGSRIIITTRDEHVLKTHEVNEIYEVDGLNDEHALRLFSSKAFKGKHVPNDYLELSKHFLNYARGLPLALEVLGSFLNGKSIAEWKSALERLKDFPERIILQALKISFDGLRDAEKEIFLHIACFLNHKEKDHVLEVLDSLGLHPVIGLKELIDKSLLKITYMHIVWMHDLLEEMGKDIVRNECLNDPGKRSRLWCYKDIESVLKKNKGMKAVQAMHILCNYDKDEHEVKETCWSPEAISQMYNLKFLRIYGIFQDPQHLPNSLRVLCWSYYPSNSLPSTFQPDELVMLCLPHSRNEQLCIGIKNFDKLKIIDLSSSGFIISPDFTGVPNLEKLNLSSCQKLRELHPSVGILKKLVHFDLKFCENLVCLPNTICSLNSLERLDLCGCSNFDNLPENLGNLKGLKELNLSGTSIKELPSSIDGLTALTSLTLQDCENLVCLPSTICSLKLLECLDLYGCSNFDNLPENLGNLKGLKNLHLSGTAIKELPSSIDGLTTLTSLTLNDCKNLVCLPSIICSLNSLERLDLYGCSNFDNLPENLGNLKGLKNLHLSGTAIKELPSSIDGLTTLTSLTLNDCKNLVCLPSTICSLNSLERLDLCGCSNFDNLLENLGNLNGLKNLHLSGTAIKELPSSIDGLTTLTSLTLWSCRNLVCLPNTICCLISLECLEISGCSSFEYLPENLGNVKGLKKLGLSGSAIKELPSSIERLMHLTSLNLLDCFNLGCLPNTTCGFKFHGTLDLSTCSRFKNLPEMPWIIEGLLMLDLSNTVIEEMPSSIGRLTDLTALTLRFCMNLVRLPSTICSWKSLESLDLLGCLKFKNLPKNIGNMKDLEVLNLCWTSIIEFPSSIVLLKNLKHLYIRGWKLSEFYSQSASLELMDPLWNLPFSQPTSPQECIGLPSFLYSSLPTSPVLVGLLLPSLSGLHSLTYLCINDCDLLSIPDDIGCLSSLECLNLSGNNFVSLPESMSQLFNLRRLYLEGCKRLQSLGNVLSTIDSVIANDCSSLERLPELQFYPFMSNHSLFQCFNCFKLVDYIQNGSNMLQGLPNIVIPGGEIPKWFSNEFQGDNIQLSFPGCDELMGIVLCVVFVPNGSHQYHRNWNFTCIFQLNGLKIADFSQSYYFTTKYGRIESPHIWLLYLSTHRSVSNWGKICSRIDANGFRQLKIQIFAEVVEKIGVQLVYKQDMEDPNQTMAQCISNNSTLYEDFGVVHHDIDNSPIESSRNKQSRDVDDGAGPSGEGYSNEEPQPKWIQGEIFDYFAMEGGDQISKKLESIHGGKEDIYQDIEDPNQTLTQLSINSRKLYEELGDLSHDSYNSAAEGSRIKRRLDEEDGAGPSGEGYSNNEPHPKTRRMYG
ncbi:TMV resistance protein N-like isoform X31 [Quercus robur]|uniref:TMV resistance protein N-like isoform X31 n=1 Tax=Quercus robur TaxID=38942 RepID=UPI002161F579|nr:TMV resistance protein N-like isoform X31 [Quercus robur]